MEDNINKDMNIDASKIILDGLRIGNYVTGQRWITLNGNFTSSELYEIADKIESSYNKAFKNVDKK